MKQFTFLILSACICTFSCSLVEDFDKIKEPEWNPEFAFPLVTANVSLEQFFGNLGADDFIETDPNTGRMKFSHRASIFTQREGEVFSMPNSSIPMIDSSLSIPSFLGGIDLVLLKSGSIDYSFESPYSGEVEVVIRIDNLTKDGQSLEQRISFTSPFNVNGQIDLTGYTFDLTDGAITLSYSAITVGDGQRRLLPNFLMDFKDLSYTAAQGFFGQFTIDVPTAITEFKVIDGVISEGISLDEVELDLIVSNSLGIPSSLEIQMLEAITLDGDVIPFSNTLFENPIPIQYPSLNEVGQSRTTTIHLDSENSNIGQIVSSNPASFQYQFQVLAHPDNDPQEVGFVLDNSEVSAWVDLEVPLYGRISNLFLNDTLDIDLSGLDMGDKADIRLFAENGFPLDAFIQFYFLNEQGMFLDSLIHTSTKVLEAASVNADGIADGRNHSVIDIPISEARFEKLLDAKQAIIRTRIQGPNEGSTAIRLKNDYDLNIKLGIKAGL